MKLGTKFALAVSLSFSIVMAIATIALIVDELDFVEEEMDLHGQLLGRVVASAAGETLAERGEREARELVREIDRHEARIVIRWIDVELDETTSLLAGEVLDRLRRGEAVGRINPQDDDTLYTYVPVPSDMGLRHVIQIAESLETTSAHVRELLLRIIVGALIGLLLGAVIAYLFGRRLVDQPIARLIEVARGVGRGDFSLRAEEGQGELGALAHEMNEMTANLERARAAEERQDATRRQLEAQLQHADRLATLGQLASGVAHEVGTPLQAITIRADLIANKAGHVEGTRESVEAIKRQSQRVASIVRALLRFARKQTPKRAPHDLAEIARSALALVETARPPGAIEIVTRLDSDVAPAEVDEEQIEQVVINLVLNGIQSMPDGGRLTVGIERAAGQPPGDVEDPAKQYLCLYVQDQGGGIPDEVLPHLFEPFFTTKGVDEGTGLGLSIAYGIVREHRGWIDVETEAGRGSRFSVHLPVAETVD